LFKIALGKTLLVLVTTRLTSNVSYQNHCGLNNISNHLTYMKITVMTDIEENIEDVNKLQIQYT